VPLSQGEREQGVEEAAVSEESVEVSETEPSWWPSFEQSSPRVSSSVSRTCLNLP
jgi:hypothetical protein